MKPTVFSIKKWILLGLCLTSYGLLHAQNAEKLQKTAMIYGKVNADNSRQGIFAASVQLFLQSAGKTSLLKATNSSKKGEFVFNELDPAAKYSLHLHANGYHSKQIDVAFPNQDLSLSNPIKDLGTIQLEKDFTQLDTFNVNSNRQLLQLFPDKRVYQVEKDISNAGTTIEDALKNIPGIIVDLNGTVLVRNNAPQIFVDGRPSTLLLSQIPTDQVERVELMTNPSVKYDASGSGGIVNIILKKNKSDGYNGSLRAGIDSRLQPLTGADLNFKKRQFNFFSTAQLSARKSLGTASSQRIEFFSPGTLTTNQTNAPENRGYFGSGRVGVDYFVNNRTTITTWGSFGKGSYKVEDLLQIKRDSVPPTPTSSSYIKRELGADIDFKSTGALVAVKHNFQQAGKEISADFSYNSHQNDNTSKYQSIYFDSDGNEKPAVGAELATGRGISRFYTFQTDFVNPGPKLSKFEAGMRVAARNYESYNRNYRETPAGSTDFRLLPTTGVEFNFEDIVFAAYGNYSNDFKTLKYQVGLRLESSFYEGELINKNQKFKTEYPLNLFPAVYLTQKISEKQSLHINYSRKINRPNFFQILPFVDFSDSLNLNIGNPALLPEFSNIGELLYQLDYKNNQALFASLYVRQSTDLISRYQYKAPNTNPAFTDSLIYNSFANAGSSYTYGLELISRNKVGNYWEILSNLNLFDVHLNAGNLAGASNQAQKSWYGKMIHSFKFPYSITFQLTGDYQARTLLPPGFSRNSSNASFGGGMYGFTANISQGYVKPIYGVDFSIKKDFLKNNAASISVQVNDVFRTRTYETVATSNFFQQENFRRRDPQVVRVNFSWKFGKLDAGLEKRRNNRSESEILQVQP